MGRGSVVKHLVLKLSDEFYEELKKRAQEEGFALVSDYVLELLSRELERSPFNPRALEARLERLERGELPPALQEAIWRLVEEAISDKLASALGEGGEINITVNEDEIAERIMDKIMRKLERKLVDMVNPWSEKVDKLALQLSELREKLEELEEKLKQEEAPQAPKKEATPVKEERFEHRFEHKEEHRTRTRKRAIDILRERKVNFEEDMSFARNLDKLLEKLRRDGAIVIETTKYGRIAIHPEAWEEFWSKLQEAGSSDEEVREVLDDERLFRLFEALREDGLIYYKAGEGWTMTPELRRAVGEGNV